MASHNISLLSLPNMKCCSDATLRNLPNTPRDTPQIIHTSPLKNPQKVLPSPGPSPFSAPDRVITMLQKILEEQSDLRKILRDNQQAIIPRLDDISASVSFLAQPQQPQQPQQQQYMMVMMPAHQAAALGRSPVAPAPQMCPSTDTLWSPPHAFVDAAAQPADFPARVLDNDTEAHGRGSHLQAQWQQSTDASTTPSLDERTSPSEISSRRFRIVNPRTGQEVQAGQRTGNDMKRPLRIVNPKTGEQVFPHPDIENSTCTPLDTPPTPYGWHDGR